MWDSLVYAVVFLHFDKSFVQPHNFAFALSISLQNRLYLLVVSLRKEEKIKAGIAMRFDCLELCLLKNEAISIPNNLKPAQFSRLICRRRKRNKTGVLRRVFEDRRTER